MTMAKGTLLRFEREGQLATIAEYDGRVAIQALRGVIIRRPTITSAIAWMESRGYNLLIDEWRAWQ